MGAWFVFAAAAVFLALPVPLLLLTTLHQSGHAELADLLYFEPSAVFIAVALLTAGGQAATGTVPRRQSNKL